MSSKQTSVRVALRVRPLGASEIVNNQSSIVTYPLSEQVAIRDKRFTFDHVFNEGSTQVDVYRTCVKDLVQDFFKGYNATILAYGQTGSGKTFTMGTGNSSTMLKDEYGVIPNVITELFNTIEATQETQFIVRVAFLEIHNDVIKDLLCETHDNNNLSIREYVDEATGETEIRVADLTNVVVKSYSELMQQLEFGSLSRATASTQMNAHSSRSHACFSIYVTQTKSQKSSKEEASEESLSSKFHFVDLAGSERLKRTGATGDRAREGININSGLLALGNVISALGDPARKAMHVPFRDSKITRLLQDSLGGNSQTLMIACVSPAENSALETLNTLKYANRAKNIKNKPVINRDPNSAKIEKMRDRIRVLETQLAHGGGTVNLGEAADREELRNMQRNNADLEKEVLRLMTALKQSRSDVSSVRDNFLEAQKQERAALLKFEEVVKLVDPNDPALQKITNGSSEKMGVLEQNLKTINGLRGRLEKQKLSYKRKEEELTKLRKTVEHDNDVFTKQRDKISRLTMTNTELEFQRETDRKLKERVANAKAMNIEASNMAESDDDEMKGTADCEAVADDNGVEEMDVDGTDDRDRDADNEEDEDDHEDSEDGDDDDEDCEKNSEEVTQMGLEKKHKKRDHDLNQQYYTSLISDLDESLSKKQQVLDELARTRKELHHVKELSENRIQNLEFEIKQVEDQRDKVLGQVQKQNEKPKRVLLDKYNNKLKRLQTDLSSTKSKLKDSQAMIRARSKNDMKFKSLQTEIDNIKKQKVTASRKFKEESAKFREWTNETNKKIKSMTKQKRKMDHEYKKMQSKYEAQNRVLKRKNESHVVLARQLRESKRKAAGVRKRYGSGSTHSNNQLFVKNLKKKFDKEIRNILQRRKLMRDLRDAKIRRTELLEQKTADTSVIENLRWECSRVSDQKKREETEQQIHGLEDSLEGYDVEIAATNDRILKIGGNLSDLGVHVKSGTQTKRKRNLEASVYLKVPVERTKDAQSLLLRFMNETANLYEKLQYQATRQTKTEMENSDLRTRIREFELARKQAGRNYRRMQSKLAMTRKLQQNTPESKKIQTELTDLTHKIQLLSPQPVGRTSRRSETCVPPKKLVIDVPTVDLTNSPPPIALASTTPTAAQTSSFHQLFVQTPLTPSSKPPFIPASPFKTSKKVPDSSKPRFNQYPVPSSRSSSSSASAQSQMAHAISPPPSPRSSSSQSSSNTVYDRLSDPSNYTGSVKENFKDGPRQQTKTHEPVLNKMKVVQKLGRSKRKISPKSEPENRQDVWSRLTNRDNYTGVQKLLGKGNEKPDRATKRRKPNTMADKPKIQALRQNTFKIPQRRVHFGDNTFKSPDEREPLSTITDPIAIRSFDTPPPPSSSNKDHGTWQTSSCSMSSTSSPNTSSHMNVDSQHISHSSPSKDIENVENLDNSNVDPPPDMSAPSKNISQFANSFVKRPQASLKDFESLKPLNRSGGGGAGAGDGTKVDDEDSEDDEMDDVTKDLDECDPYKTPKKSRPEKTSAVSANQTPNTRFLGSFADSYGQS